MIPTLDAVSAGRAIPALAEERWVRTPTGYEQSWIVAQDPGVPLWIDVPVDAVVRRDGAGLCFVSAEGQVWTIRPAEAWDADGSPLPATMEPTPEGYRILVDTAGARWPVTVDPFYDAGALELDLGSVYGWTESPAARGDTNGDGFGDLVLGSGDALGVWFGGSSGPGAASDIHYSLAPEYGVNWVTGLGDVDGDNRDDVAAVAADHLLLWRGDASGLTQGDTVPLDWPGATLHPIGDFDGDGQDDLLAADSDQGHCFAALLTGDGAGFRVGPEFDLPGYYAYDYSTTPNYHGFLIDGVGDTNQDGYADFVVDAASGDGAAILTWWGGAEPPTAAWDLAWEAGADAVSVAGLGDLDGDGFAELAWTVTDEEADTRVAYASGTGAGWDVDGARFLSAPEAVYSWGRIGGAGDLDGDGTTDLLVAAYTFDDDVYTVRPWVWLGGADGFVQERVERGAGVSDATSGVVWAGDLDGDGTASVLFYGYPGENWVLDWGAEDDPDGDGHGASTDCDPFDPTVGPGTPELCDGKDNNCDGVVDEGPPADAPGWEVDADGDGFGVPPARQDCVGRADEVAAGGEPDCDDDAEWRSPDSRERCNGQDDDCDGEIDEDTPADTSDWLLDGDHDGYGAGDPVRTCDPPEGRVPALRGTDCDDTDPAIHPGALEVKGNDVDEDCDGEPRPVASSGSEGCQAVPFRQDWILLAAAIAAARRVRRGPVGTAVRPKVTR